MDSDRSNDDQDSSWRYSAEGEANNSEPEVSKRISRRKFLGGLAIPSSAAAIFGALEATDGDGDKLNLSRDYIEDPAASFSAENPEHYGWANEGELKAQTGFRHRAAGNYLGIVGAKGVEAVLEEERVNGAVDPSGILTREELEMTLDDITAVDSCWAEEPAYALDVDVRRPDSEEECYTATSTDGKYYVQLVGEEDGGLYITRRGAYEVSKLGLDHKDYLQCL